MLDSTVVCFLAGSDAMKKLHVITRAKNRNKRANKPSVEDILHGRTEKPGSLKASVLCSLPPSSLCTSTERARAGPLHQCADRGYQLLSTGTQLLSSRREPTLLKHLPVQKSTPVATGVDFQSRAPTFRVEHPRGGWEVHGGVVNKI